MEPRKTCRACGCKRLTPLFSLGKQCVSDFVSEGAVESLQYPIDIVQCPQCTLVQQLYTAPQDFMYTKHYWYRSGTTETMRAALDDVARDALDNYIAPRVLDIGSNDGTFLRAIKARSPDAYCVGVEPATNLVDEARRGVDMVLNNFWSYGALEAAGLADEKYQIVTALGMFYDLEDPNQFIRDISLVLAPDGVFIAQLMCARNMLEMNDIGNLCHEHLEFYTLTSLRQLFAKYGMEIFDVEVNEVNGQSYRLFVRHTRNRISRRVVTVANAEGDMQVDEPETWRRWFGRLKTQRDTCLRHVRKAVDAGKQVWVYGASTKGNVILQWFGLDSTLIAGAVDKSVEKHGKYTAGSGIKIHPEEVGRAKADYFLVLPYAFVNEFVAREHEWRSRGGQFMVPLPEFKIL